VVSFRPREFSKEFIESQIGFGRICDACLKIVQIKLEIMEAVP
jgi:sulfopyruvate decarboxylase TPP-binding subunit